MMTGSFSGCFIIIYKIEYDLLITTSSGIKINPKIIKSQDLNKNSDNLRLNICNYYVKIIYKIWNYRRTKAISGCSSTRLPIIRPEILDF
tara:strand:+ start:299 stop:568 length:270 start_codon:yes stop_codon:yes gene_type:complete